jgi:transcriptional regulator NrdR family protein
MSEAGFPCPVCQNLTKVIASIPNPSSTRQKRRRECYSCNFRFTTYETISTKRSLRQIKEEWKKIEPLIKNSHRLQYQTGRCKVKPPHDTAASH